MSRKNAPYWRSLGTIASTIIAANPTRISGGDIIGLGEIFKFGFNASVGSGEETIWEGATASVLYAYPSAAKVMTVSSDSSDDAAAGTGARTIKITGLDADYREITETLTLDSSVAVSSVESFLRVFRAEIETAGSGGQNDGTVYVGASTVAGGVPSEIYAQINPSENQTLMAIYTVPLGKTAYINGVHFATSANKATTFHFRLRELGGVFKTRFKVILNQEIFDLDGHTIAIAPEKTDIEITAAVATGGGDVTASFRAELVDQ